MTVLLFSPRFHGGVVSGAKTQTIRAPRARPVRPGEALSLRGWLAVPYRSPQFVLREASCRSVEPVRLERSYLGLDVEVSGRYLEGDAVEAFARADGFAGVDELLAWYAEKERPLPFEGELIRWTP